MEMIESFATMLLADSFWSTWKDRDFAIDLITQDERNEIHRSYAGQGCEIIQGMKDLVQELEIDLKPFLPLQIVQDIVDSVNEFWKGKYSVEELHEYCSRASGDLILGRVGHGVDADDDTDIAEMFKELGIETPRSYDESPYDQAENLVRKVEETLAHKYGHEWVNVSTNKYDILILAQNAGNDQAYFSVKSTSLETYKSSWTTNLNCIISMLGLAQHEGEHADWEMPFETALENMRMLENMMKSPLFQQRLHKELVADEEEYEWK